MPTTSIKSIRSSGGDYTTITAWESAQQGDLVAADEVRVAECYNDWGTSGLADYLDFNGWTTDSTRYAIIRAATGEGHDGTEGTGFVWATASTPATRHAIIRGTNKIQFDRIEFQDSGSYAPDYVIYDLNTGTVLIDNCLFRDCDKPLLAFGNNSIVRNSVFYDYASRIMSYATSTVTFYNCTIVNKTYTDTLLFRNGSYYNCVAYSAQTHTSGVWYSDCSGDYNAGSDTSAPGANSIDSQTTGDLDFVDYTNNDFHIESTSTLVGAGFAYGGMAATDIDGDSWETSPAIGFDEPAAAPAGGSSQLTLLGVG